MGGPRAAAVVPGKGGKGVQQHLPALPVLGARACGTGERVEVAAQAGGRPCSRHAMLCLLCACCCSPPPPPPRVPICLQPPATVWCGRPVCTATPDACTLPLALHVLARCPPTPTLRTHPAPHSPLLDAVVAHFAAATSAAEAAGQLRSALIHSDANERNVLVDAAAAAAAAVAERQQGSEAAAAATAVASAAPVCVDDGNGRLPQPMITGLIDWGDACWQWLASEVANCATYMMLLEVCGCAMGTVLLVALALLLLASCRLPPVVLARHAVAVVRVPVFLFHGPPRSPQMAPLAS